MPKKPQKPMCILVTGSAGFIGYHAAKRLLEHGHTVIGVDDFNHYYDPAIKERRNAELAGDLSFKLCRDSIADYQALQKIFRSGKPDIVIHLAAQAGVRYSLKNPWAYAESNYLGAMNVFEAARSTGVRTVIYASSSSVYGDNEKLPFAESDATDAPISVYAATKKANELLAHTYWKLYGISMIGLRFFTIYGDYYRPDMALFKFAKSIVTGKEITLFNKGDMSREFTHIDDAVDAIEKIIAKKIKGCELYNIGGSESIKLEQFVGLIEKGLGRKAKVRLAPIQPGDVKDTAADISKAARDLGFAPKVAIEKGVGRFCKWFLDNEAWLLKLKEPED